jgi:hypothetical protein
MLPSRACSTSRLYLAVQLPPISQPIVKAVRANISSSCSAVEHFHIVWGSHRLVSKLAVSILTLDMF